MKKDIEIQKNVMAELNNLPLLKAAEIGVAVKNGIVTLSGIVDSYPRKIAIEKAVLKIKDVKGIAEDLQVKLNGASQKSDSEIAQAALYAVEWHSGLDPERFKVFVEDAIVTLEGNVDWDYQRKLAQKTIGNLVGVKGVINNLKIAAQPIAAQVKEKIQDSFLRNAQLDSGKISVELLGHKVILKGKVRSWSEKKDAENSAWSMPGVTQVDNQLQYEDTLRTSQAY